MRWPSGRRRRFAKVGRDQRTGLKLTISGPFFVGSLVGVGCRLMVLGPSLGTLAGTLEPMPLCASWAHVEGRSRDTTPPSPCPLQCVALQLQCTHWKDPFMDDQITVRLPTPLGRTLRRTSRRLGRRPSHVVRMALEAFLQGAPSADGQRAERVEHLIGSLSSGIPDLAERHREYVLASLKHAR